MSNYNEIASRIKVLLSHAGLRFHRFQRHFAMPLRTAGKTLDILTLIASLLCIVALIIYIGFDHSSSETQLIYRLLRSSQITFICTVIFELVFNRKEMRPIQWVAHLVILVTLLPLIYTRPSHPWLPLLSNILYSRWFLFPAIGLFSIVRTSIFIIRLLGKRTNPALILGGSFIFFILAGSFILMMPRCTLHGISYIDSLFLSTSAVCITGLTTIDVATTFTPFGLLILALMIQIGGLGVMTFTSFFALSFSGNTSIYSQLMVKDMIYTKSINSLFPTLLYILIFTLGVEAIGAVAIYMSIDDVLPMTLPDKLIFSAFHAVSAFCNAGFSNLQGGLSNELLLNSNQSIYLIASALIFAGGIGFPILVNFKEAVVRHIRRLINLILHNDKGREPVHLYDMNTKLALATTLIITAVSSVLFYLFEHDNSLAGMTVWQQAVQSLFNSFVPRSSGFASVSPVNFLGITTVMMVVLMWIGGASQSTAGGIKVNTLATMLLSVRSTIKGESKVTVFNRTISPGSIRRANGVVAISIISYIIFAMMLVWLEPALPLKAVLYEMVSALFTVGSSLGITSDLSVYSKLVVCVAMFLGRVGLLSLLTGMFATDDANLKNYPVDNVIIS
ncbi:MAG: potassium transporter TrkG [Muribaculaceae bacterium]|nr:potassium transporter TrkG [Muribaculaceae bacterium]